MKFSIKFYFLIILILLVMISSNFVVSAYINNKSDIYIKTNDFDNNINIRVARYSAFGKIQDTFDEILNNYQWKVGNKTYNIKTIIITDNDIYSGELKPENYDLLIIPAADTIAKISENLFYPSISNKLWKTRITNFVKDGGGYLGYCAPTTLTAQLRDKPKTLPEILINLLDLKISGVKLIYNINLPFFAGLSDNPESIGPTAYLYFSGMGIVEKGIPLDFVINKNNPIFNDFIENKRRISWLGGPAFEISNQSNHKIDVLAYYPEMEISDNISTQIHVWKYTGGIHGFISGFSELMKYDFTLKEILEYTKYLASDWEMTDTIIQTNYANKAFMTMEKYPNENQARIILCGGHPEYPVWWGGYIEDALDTNKNCLVEGFYQWKDKNPTNKTIEDEKTYNWWIVRRQAAWASKRVPDNDLPPTYGVSQLNDIYPYIQSNNFTILGNVEESDGVESLALYYRYSNDNSTWLPWTLYDIDTEGSNGWIWQFNSPNGTGFYQFYSLRHVLYEHEWSNEKVPPGPDAIAYVHIE